MKAFANEVQRAIDEIGARARALEISHDALYLELAVRYGRGRGSGMFLWGTFDHAVSVHDTDAWQWLGEYLRGRRCLLLFDRNDDETIFEFDGGDELVNVLGETYHFEFYITDEQASFVICFNHHDVLIADGGARSWLEARRGR